MAISVRVVTDRNGRRHVLMPMKHYEDLLRRLEDRSDLEVLRERSRESVVPLDQVRRKLGLA